MANVSVNSKSNISGAAVVAGEYVGLHSKIGGSAVMPYGSGSAAVKYASSGAALTSGMGLSSPQTLSLFYNFEYFKA